MRRRAVLATSFALTPMLTALPDPVLADASHAPLASYYDRHGALLGGVVHGWEGTGAPQPLRAGIVQVAVSRDAWYGVGTGGDLMRWTQAEPAPAQLLRRGVARVAAGASGWIAIDRDGTAWQAGGDDQPVRVMTDVVDACIGDSADYLVTRDGRLHVRGLAHRGQYGDGLLRATPDYVATATEAVAVRAHTGHAVHLRRDGTVFGTGGNRFGPLSTHGLGDKADRWGPIFEGATAIATGSRHTLALRADGSLCRLRLGSQPRCSTDARPNPSARPIPPAASSGGRRRRRSCRSWSCAGSTALATGARPAHPNRQVHQWR